MPARPIGYDAAANNGFALGAKETLDEIGDAMYDLIQEQDYRVSFTDADRPNPIDIAVRDDMPGPENSLSLIGVLQGLLFGDEESVTILKRTFSQTEDRNVEAARSVDGNHH